MDTGKDIVLKLDHLTIKFGGLVAVNDFSLEIEKGELIGLIGPNGAGKTTVFNMVTGQYEPTSGSIFLEAQNITGWRPDLIAAAGIARTFQNVRLFTGLSVLDNVLVSQHLRLKSPFLSAALSLPDYSREEREVQATARELLDRLELTAYAYELAGNLPYGRQRRLEIARALATGPKLLLLDEPAAGMNPEETARLMKFICRIRDEFDLTIFLIEHDMKLVMGICERIRVIDYGISIAEGSPSTIQRDPRVIAAYLGEGGE